MNKPDYIPKYNPLRTLQTLIDINKKFDDAGDVFGFTMGYRKHFVETYESQLNDFIDLYIEHEFEPEDLYLGPTVWADMANELPEDLHRILGVNINFDTIARVLDYDTWFWWFSSRVGQHPKLAKYCDEHADELREQELHEQPA